MVFGQLFFYMQFLSVSIVAVNYFLRVGVIYIVKQIGFSSRSAETKNIMIFVFLLQFFNTGPLLLLINADFSELEVPLLNKLQPGPHSDFGPKWYQFVGETLINTMCFNLMWPVMEFVIFYALRTFWRLKDMNFGWNRGTTKQTRI